LVPILEIPLDAAFLRVWPWWLDCPLLHHIYLAGRLGSLSTPPSFRHSIARPFWH
jgi:hypothetical protein